MEWRQKIFAAFVCLIPCAYGLSETSPSALRAAVPLLCTENLASRTYVRGTGVIVDLEGTLLTAAHVIESARANCTLSVMIPDDEWNRVGRLRRFVLARCDLNQTVDIAICRVKPADSIHDLDYLHPAQVRFRPPVSREPVWLTGFTGWLMVPLVRVGHVIGEESYRTQDGCRCNFATDIVAVEGMSGSPIISLDGEVVGIITQAGRGSFRGISFGTSLREVRDFLAAHGLVSPSPKMR